MRPTITNADLESNLEAFFSTAVRRAGGMSIKLAPIMAGTPDRLVLLPGGRMILVELKAPSGRLAPIQREWHRRAGVLGTEVLVLRGRNEVFDWIESLPNY
jgi:hypothetical protein